MRSQTRFSRGIKIGGRSVYVSTWLEFGGADGRRRLCRRRHGRIGPASPWRVAAADEADGFAGVFLEDTATIEFSAEQEGFTFVSDPAETTVTHFAEIGEERDGVFFH
jgi:hypothetical protein